MDVITDIKSLDILLKSLERLQNRPIVDPFSTSALIPLNHASRAYPLSALEQLEEQKPEKCAEVKETILSCIHPDYRADFFEHLSNHNLFINGAAEEMIDRCVGLHINVDDLRKVLYVFNKEASIKGMAAKALGLDFVLNFIQKATQNVTQAININLLSAKDTAKIFDDDHLYPDPDDDDLVTRCFSYCSTKGYRSHMIEHFEDEPFESIEDKKFALTLKFFEMMPALLTVDGNQYGMISRQNTIGNVRYFMVHYPKAPFYRRVVTLFTSKKKTIERAAKWINEEAKRDWMKRSKRLENALSEFDNKRRLVENEIHLSMERADDLGQLVSPTIRVEIDSRRETLKSINEEISAVQLPKFELKMDVTLSTPEDFLDLANILDHHYSAVESYKRLLEKQEQRFRGHERAMISLLVECYNQAEEKNVMLHKFLEFTNEKDTYVGHIFRVADIAFSSAQFANDMHIIVIDPAHVAEAALYHDIGKILTPREILTKNGRPNEWEWKVIKNHVLHGPEILAGMNFPKHVIDAAHYHHEWYGGSKERAYPQQMIGEEIPEIARLISWADVFDAIAGSAIDRKYDSKIHGQVRNYDSAMKELLRCSGTQFDPRFAPVFITMAESGFFREYYERKYSEHDDASGERSRLRIVK